MRRVEHDHLRATPRPAPRPDRRRPRISRAHKRHRPARQAAARHRLAGGADRREVDPGATPLLKDQPLAGVPVEQLGDRVLGLQDEARRGQRTLAHPGVEPHRRGERRALGNDQRGQLVPKRVALPSPAHLTALKRPRGDSPDDPVHQPPHGMLASATRFGGEVAPSHHRDRQPRPAERSLDIVGRKRHTPVSLRDPHRAPRPLNQLEPAPALARQRPLDKRSSLPAST